MKEQIRTLLRENTEKNSLNVLVTRPNQELIIIRGIPGSGKSTKSKGLVGNGVIHSTDDLIELNGDYREFFAKMISSGDFTPLSRMHSKNLSNAKESMKNGISPIIIDNTNIKQNEPKAYILAALEFGYSDKNIKFVDIGTAGLEAEVLAARNKHGVPLEKIKSMIDSYTSQGEMTLNSVLSSKDMYKSSDVLYSAVVLTKESQELILGHNYPVDIPKGWKQYGHHMTIAFGKGIKDKNEIDKEVTLKVIKLGISRMAMAVQVEGYESNNKIPHITLAINPNGGKPVMSNDIAIWSDIKPFNVIGHVKEIKK